MSSVSRSEMMSPQVSDAEDGVEREAKGGPRVEVRAAQQRHSRAPMESDGAHDCERKLYGRSQGQGGKLRQLMNFRRSQKSLGHVLQYSKGGIRGPGHV